MLDLFLAIGLRCVFLKLPLPLPFPLLARVLGRLFAFLDVYWWHGAFPVGHVISTPCSYPAAHRLHSLHSGPFS